MKEKELKDNLNNLRIDANGWLDKYHPIDKVEILKQKKATLIELIELSKVFDEPFENEHHLCTHIMGYCQDTGKSQGEALLELGIYALAWDSLTSQPSQHGTDKE